MNLARNYFAIPPGQGVFEAMILNDKSMSEMAQALAMSEASLQKLLDGSLVIDEALAQLLAQEIGKSANHWLQLESQYRRRMALKEGQKQFLDEDYNIQLEW